MLYLFEDFVLDPDRREYLDGHFVGSRRRHALCHDYLDELMPATPEPARATATICPFRPLRMRKSVMC
jgi:hypothetical protein